MSEIVYVLINEAMEGLVKIGRTTTGVEQRIRELDNTSTPLPFQCFYAAEVKDAALVEKKLHQAFSDKRVRSNREFFRIDPNQVKAAVQIGEIREVTPKADVVIDASDIQALKTAALVSDRKSRLAFSELDIPNMVILKFSKDELIQCKVVGDGRVDFEGKIMSPSAAALIVIHRMGYQWSAVSGSDYWIYEDETLAARRLRFEDEQ